MTKPNGHMIDSTLIYSDIAQTMLSQQLYDEALKLCQLTIKLRIKKFGNLSISVIQSMLCYADILCRLEYYDKASSIIKDAFSNNTVMANLNSFF